MRIPCIFVSLLFLSSCKTDKEKLIIGKWNAIHLLECEEIVLINTALVNLEFQANGKYIFNSTLNIHEEGDFRISNNYLYTHDKVKSKAVEKAVKIRYVSEDSLVLEMNYKGKEQWLTLMKENTAISKEAMAKIQQDKDVSTASSNPVAPVAPLPVTKKNTAKISEITEGGHALPVVSKPEKEQPKTAKTEDKKVEKPVEKKTQKEMDADKKEAYLKREAQRKKEETLYKQEEVRRHDAYLKREAQRKKDEAKIKEKKKK